MYNFPILFILTQCNIICLQNVLHSNFITIPYQNPKIRIKTTPQKKGLRYMKQTTITYSQEAPANLLAFGPTIAELQQNPVPENLLLSNKALPYRMINDALFHIVMEANPAVLKSLLCALLNVNEKNINSIKLMNPFELGNTIYDKNYVLDLKIALNDNTLINIEVQVLNLKFWKERSLGYLCRTFDNLNKGDDYSETKPAIQIGILDFEIFEGDTKFFATYHLANDISHKIYSDKFRLSVLQLNQTEHATDEDISCKRVLWAKFFKATTWEEVSTLANQDPIFAEAAKTIYRVTEDERVRYHCDAIERGERTQRTLVNQLNDQEQEIARLQALLKQNGIKY